MITLNIDPGNVESAFLFYDTGHGKPLRFGIVANGELLAVVRANRHGNLIADEFAVEKIAMGGMVAGQETFDTAMWVGRFVEAWNYTGTRKPATLVRRIDEKMHLCHDSRAKDTNIRQALIDKFGPGKDVAIGKKKSPGPLFGVAADVWSALAIAVTYAEGGVRG